MALSLIVEDGTNVANANSYATLTQIMAACAQRGVTLPSDPDAVIALSSTAMDYLATYENRLLGQRTYGMNQDLSWPRCRCTYNGNAQPLQVFGTTLPPTFIPRDIIAVQCYLVGIAQCFDLIGNQDTLNITKEAIGPIQTEYSATSGAAAGPILPAVTAMLRPYMKTGLGPLQSTRV